MHMLTEYSRWQLTKETNPVLINISDEGPFLSEASISKIQSAIKRGMPLSLYRASTHVKDVRFSDTIICKAVIRGKMLFVSLITGQLFKEDGTNYVNQDIRIIPKTKEKRISQRDAARLFSMAGKEFESGYGRTGYYIL